MSVAQGWRQGWKTSELSGVKEVVVPVAVDERAQSWPCVSVTPLSDRETSEEATRLRVIIYDSERLRRQKVMRVIRNGWSDSRHAGLFRRRGTPCGARCCTYK